MIIVFLLMMLAIGAMFHFEPLVDKNELGQTIITYRTDRRSKTRKQKVLW